MRRNVLITACGAKVALVRAFRRAATARGLRTLAADVVADAVALREADAALRLPRWSDPGYGEALVAACTEHAVGLLVPTADAEMPWLLPVVERLSAVGTTVLLPSARTLSICRDKRALVEFCRAHGFAVPETFDADWVPTGFPVFARPAQGQGGMGAGRVDTPALLAALREIHPDLLVQAYVDEPEYSVDLLMDLEGRPLQAVARRRVAVRGGEAIVCRVERVDALTDTVMRLGEVLGLVGHNVVQAFWSPESGPRIIEINPRFGGASNLAIEAGLDSPARLLDLLAGDPAVRTPRAIRHGLTLLRYGEDRFVSEDDIEDIFVAAEPLARGSEP